MYFFLQSGRCLTRSYRRINLRGFNEIKILKLFVYLFNNLFLQISKCSDVQNALEVFYKKGVLRNFAKFIRKTPVPEFFFK